MFHPLYFDMAGRIPVFDLIETGKNKKDLRALFSVESVAEST